MQIQRLIFNNGEKDQIMLRILKCARSLFSTLQGSSAIEMLLMRHNLEFRTAGASVRVKECFFCPKPTMGKLDNLYTLNIDKQNGLYYCHRCSAKGNQVALNARLNGVDTSQVDCLSYQGVAGNIGAATEQPLITRVDQLQFFGKVQSLESPNFKQVLDYLINQRKFTPEVIKKYKLGAGKARFINELGQTLSINCVYFPTFRPSSALERKNFLQSKLTISEINSQNKLQNLMNNQRVQLTKLKLRGAGADLKNYMRQQPAGAQVGLFGLNLCLDDHKQIVITEGEYDAMSVHQVTGLPAVSLPMGAAHLPFHILPWLQRFETVYLWMDNDAVGLLNEPKLINKLGINRTRTVRISDKNRKDANDYLKANQPEGIKQAIAKSKTMPSMHILNFQQLKQRTKNKFMRYEDQLGVKSESFKFFNQKVKGLRTGQVSILSGGTGCGKTTLLAQLSLDFCKQGVRTLWGSFQVANQTLLLTMLQQFSKINLVKNKQKFDFYAQQFQKLPFFFLSFHGSTEAQRVLATIRYAVQKLDISHVIVDTLQFMLSGQGEGFRKFDLQDSVMAEFRQLASQLKVHVTVVIHPRKHEQKEDLGIHTIFGTAKSTQEADNVWLIQIRDGYKIWDIKKNRFDGQVGRAALGFDKSCRSFFQLRGSELHGLVNKATTMDQILERRKKGEFDVQQVTGVQEEIDPALFSKKQQFKMIKPQ